MSWFHRNKAPAIVYDPALRRPAVRRSICTGEMTVGFIEISTGRFIEYGLARDRQALEAFCRRVGVDPEEITTIY